LTWLLLALALAASGWLVTRGKRATPEPARAADVLDAVPAGPALLLTVDVEALGEAAALELLRAGGSALLGLRELCGFEPLLGLRQVALAVPPREPTETPDFALIARTVLDQEPVLRCAEVVIRKRGGTPVRSRLGRFDSVRDQHKPQGEIAIRDDGLFVLSGGRYFRDVVDAANGSLVPDAGARGRAALHVRVRPKLRPSQVVLSALPGSPLWLPGADVLGVGLDVRDDVRLRGFVACSSAADCGELHGLLLRALAEAAKEPGLSALAAIHVLQEREQLEISGTVPRAELGSLLGQLTSP
jgi:hypothetical protein